METTPKFILSETAYDLFLKLEMTDNVAYEVIPVLVRPENEEWLIAQHTKDGDL